MRQVAVAFLDDVAEVNADPDLDSSVGLHARIALNHRGSGSRRRSTRPDARRWSGR